MGAVGLGYAVAVGGPPARMEQLLRRAPVETACHAARTTRDRDPEFVWDEVSVAVGQLMRGRAADAVPDCA